MEEVVKRKCAAYGHTTPLYVWQAWRVCLTLSGLCYKSLASKFDSFFFSWEKNSRANPEIRKISNIRLELKCLIRNSYKKRLIHHDSYLTDNKQGMHQTVIKHQPSLQSDTKLEWRKQWKVIMLFWNFCQNPPTLIKQRLSWIVKYHRESGRLRLNEYKIVSEFCY